MYSRSVHKTSTEITTLFPTLERLNRRRPLLGRPNIINRQEMRVETDAHGVEMISLKSDSHSVTELGKEPQTHASQDSALPV